MQNFFEAICDIKVRTHPSLSYRGHGSKLLLVLPLVYVACTGNKSELLGNNGDTCLLWMGKFILGTNLGAVN